MIIIFASAFAIGLAGRVHAEERKDNRLENTTFENNTAEPDGAVIALEPDPNFHTSFINNTAESGGAIYWNGEDITDIPFKNNTAGSGGAIYWHDEDITDITFKNNTAGSGGAIFVG